LTSGLQYSFDKNQQYSVSFRKYGGPKHNERTRSRPEEHNKKQRSALQADD